MFSEVGRGTGRPQISARTRAMMLMMLTGRPQSGSPARAMMLAAEAAGRGTKRDGAAGRAGGIRQRGGGGGGPRARAQGPPPSARSSLPPAQ